jgi:Polyketide cyclase / dehydrase and lipid transport
MSVPARRGTAVRAHHRVSVATVSIQTRICAPASLLWDMVGRFNTLGQWHPLVRRSDTHGVGKGAVRRVGLISGGTLVERLEHVSNAERVYLYSLVEGPFPVEHCVSEIRVTDTGDGASVVSWSSNFIASGVPDREAAKALHAVFNAGLQNIKRIYESLSHSDA